MKISELEIRWKLNPRKELDEATVSRYRETIDVMPPIVVQAADAPPYVLIDGFHRVEAMKQLGHEDIPEVEMVDVPDNQLFAEACRRNLGHGLPLSKDERNGAIVRLSQDGYTQEALSKMFGVDQGTVSRTIGAIERTQRIMDYPYSGAKGTITPTHEKVIRKVKDEGLQDKLAEVVLTRTDGPKPKPLTVSQTNTLANMANEEPEKAEWALDHLLANPEERGVIGTDNEGSIDADSIKAVIADTRKNPGMAAEWACLIRDICGYKVKYPMDEAIEMICAERHGIKGVMTAIEFFDDILARIEVYHANKS